MLEASPDRVGGPHAGCAGCDWAHFAPRRRPNGEARALSRNDAADRKARAGPLRRTTDSAVRSGLSPAHAPPCRGATCGYYAPGSHRVVTAAACEAISSETRALLPRLEGAVRDSGASVSEVAMLEGMDGARRLVRATASEDPALGGAPGGRARRLLRRRSNSLRRREAATRARRPLAHDVRGRPGVLRLRGQLLSGKPLPRRDALRRRRGRGPGDRPRLGPGRLRGRRPLRGSASGGAACRPVGRVGRRRGERTPVGPARAGRTGAGGRSQRCRFRGSSRRTTGASTASSRTRPAPASAPGSLASSRAGRRPGSCTSPAIRRPSRGTCPNPGRGLRDPSREALRPLRLHAPGGGARRARARGVIRPVLAEGEAPAARAAVVLVSGDSAAPGPSCGTAAGCRARGRFGGGAGARERRLPGRRRSLAFAGFLVRGGIPVRPDADRGAGGAGGRRLRARGSGAPAVRLEGVLADFWTGSPPRARSMLRAERVEAGGVWRGFPAEVVVFVSGEGSAFAAADRGDRVRMTGHLEAEDLPASEREMPLPWPRYRLSVKSAQLVEREGATLLSALAAPNRVLFAALPPGKGPAYERDVRGPLAALLLGRTSELDRGMVARYRRGGLYHLLVVSGLHVVLAAGLVGFFLALVRGRGQEARRRARRRGLPLRARGRRQSAGRARRARRRDLPRDAPARAADHGSAGDRALGARSISRRAGADLLGRHHPDIRRRVRDRDLRQTDSGRGCRSGPSGSSRGSRVALAAECATAPVLFWRFNIVAAGAWLTAPFSIPLAGALIGWRGAPGRPVRRGDPARPAAGPLCARQPRRWSSIAERAAGIASCGRRRRLRPSASSGRSLLAAGLGPRRLRVASGLLAAAVFLALALRRGPAGPAARLLDRGPRRGAGRRDTPALETQGDSRGRGRSLRRDGHRFRAHPARAEAPRPGSDAARCRPGDPSAPGPRARSLRRPRGARGRRALAIDGRRRGRPLCPARGGGGPRRVPVRPLEPLDVWERDGRAALGPALGRADAKARRRQQPVGRGSLREGRPKRPPDGRRRGAGGGGARRCGRARDRWTLSRSAITAAEPRRRPSSSRRSARGWRSSRAAAAIASAIPRPRRSRRSGAPACRSSAPTSGPTRARTCCRRPRGSSGAGRKDRERGSAPDAARAFRPDRSGQDGRRPRGRAPDGGRDRFGRRLRRLPRSGHRNGQAVPAGAPRGRLPPDRRRRAGGGVLGRALGERWRGRPSRTSLRAAGLPIVCGGSGFYISALLEGLPPGEARDERLREALFEWAWRRGPAAAHRFLSVNDPVSARRISGRQPALHAARPGDPSRDRCRAVGATAGCERLGRTVRRRPRLLAPGPRRA